MESNITLALAELSDAARISAAASEIFKEHYDPIIGAEQTDYMIKLFQTEEAILRQMKEGHTFGVLCENDTVKGYFACYPKSGMLYLDKYYIHRSMRGKGCGRLMLQRVIEIAKEKGFSSIFLNVNKYNSDSISIYEHFGFRVIRAEKNPIGKGYYMDDYVLQLDIE